MKTKYDVEVQCIIAERDILQRCLESAYSELGRTYYAKVGVEMYKNKRIDKVEAEVREKCRAIREGTDE